MYYAHDSRMCRVVDGCCALLDRRLPPVVSSHCMSYGNAIAVCPRVGKPTSTTKSAGRRSIQIRQTWLLYGPIVHYTSSSFLDDLLLPPYFNFFIQCCLGPIGLDPP